MERWREMWTKRFVRDLLLRTLCALLLGFVLSSPTPAAEPQPAVTLDCVPRTTLTPTASGTQLRLRVTTGGWWWGTWCPNSPGPYVHIVLNGYEWSTTNQIALTAMALLSEADALAGLCSAIAVNTVPVSPALQTTWDNIRAEALVAMVADAPSPPASAPPPIPMFKVKDNSASTTVPRTRPAYGLGGGVLGTKELGRAVVGEACSPGRPTLAAKTVGETWMEFGPAFVPGVVAICVQAN
jgi:hypothetical protein